MSTFEFEQAVQRTLLYYEIFDYPLSSQELYSLFPKNSIPKQEFTNLIEELVHNHKLRKAQQLFQLSFNSRSLPEIRKTKEKLARRRLFIAKLAGQIIKRFPFVRGVFLSGELSKRVSSPESDIDFIIITASKRLWVSRTLLILFKKIFLFNSKKYFCLNYFVTENNLEVYDHNYYTATEIAHLKPIYNYPLFLRYMNANNWIKDYFPNYFLHEFVKEQASTTPSWLQKGIELLFPLRLTDTLDVFLMNKMKKIWKNRYPQFNETSREKIFRSTEKESRAFVGNFEEKILALYNTKLQENGLTLL